MHNSEKENIRSLYKKLKEKAGTHSPSISNLKSQIPELEIKVDACFLSNPYATELFFEHFNNDLIATKRINNILEYYPSQNNSIAQVLGNELGINPNKIFISNGAIEAIQAIIHRFVNGKILITIPTFSSYYEYAKPTDEVIYYNLKKETNFQLDIEDYIQTVRKTKPNTIVLINPNNPDGGYVESKSLKIILEELSWVENIIIDESFIHFSYEDEKMHLNSIVSYLTNQKNIYVIKSMSKDFGIAGIRCGYAIMSENKVSTLLENGYLWNSNGLAEYFYRLYSKKEFINQYELVRKKYIFETIDFIKKLETFNNIKAYPTKANFILIELLNGLNAEEVTTDLLCDFGVYVRNCDDKIGLDGQFIRVAARSMEENRVIIKALESVTQI